jgi:hypothetical protein
MTVEFNNKQMDTKTWMKNNVQLLEKIGIFNPEKCETFFVIIKRYFDVEGNEFKLKSDINNTVHNQSNNTTNKLYNHNNKLDTIKQKIIEELKHYNTIKDIKLL